MIGFILANLSNIILLILIILMIICILPSKKRISESKIKMALIKISRVRFLKNPEPVQLIILIYIVIAWVFVFIFNFLGFITYFQLLNSITKNYNIAFALSNLILIIFAVLPTLYFSILMLEDKRNIEEYGRDKNEHK